MSYRQRLERLAKKKRREIVELESEILKARAHLEGIEESIKALPRENADPGSLLRTGSQIAAARDAILEAGNPLHIDKILKALGKKANQKSRMSLAGSISNYVRKGEVFTRPAPNTFGLLEMGARGIEPDDEDDDEPDEENGSDEDSEFPESDDDVPF